MLIAVVLGLRCTNTTWLPTDMGHAVYAETLHRLGEVEPGLGDWIRSFKESKPLTCSNLNGGTKKGGTRLFKSGEQCTIRLTGLLEPVSRGLEQLLTRPPLEWRFGSDRQHLFVSEEVVCDPVKNSWSGIGDVDALMAAHMFSATKPARKVGLEFASAVSFQSNDMNVPYPAPDLVFGSLARRWNELGFPEMSDAVKEFTRTSVGIAGYSLCSAITQFGGSKMLVGGLGRADYECLRGDSDWISAIQMLADFAFFSGVGVKTTMGMGQCRRANQRARH